MALISVIVPVYQVEAFLPRCVDSVLNQTFSDFELILVDDGSPDNCGTLCDAYAGQDSRIHVIHQKNGGLSAARNAGMDWVFANSESQWLTFLDSDDWLHPQTLEILLNAALEHNTNVSVCGFQETTGENPLVDPQSAEVQVWTPKDFYLQQIKNFTVPWGKLYRRDCFETIRYPVGKIHEDEFVTYRILFPQERLAVTALPLYAYFVNPTGITRKAWSAKRLHAWQAYEEQLLFFAQLGDPELQRRNFREYIDNAFTTLQTAEQAPNQAELRPVIRKMEKHLRKLIRRAWKLGYMEFWMDFAFLKRMYPGFTKLYQYYLEHRY